jgi:hypothetical protein
MHKSLLTLLALGTLNGSASRPVVYLPKSSACLNSLRPNPSYKSASHSAYADVFHGINDKAEASAEVLNQMVKAYAEMDASCSLQYYAALKDEVSCDRFGMSTVCSLPTDLGRFVLIKDMVDSAAVIYIEGSEKDAKLGTFSSESLHVPVAQPEECYLELLDLGDDQYPETPFDSSDHHTYYLDTKNLDRGDDARKNAALLVNAVLEGRQCKYKIADQRLENDACRNLGGIDICVIAPQRAGYFIITKDTSEGAFVSFLRYD